MTGPDDVRRVVWALGTCSFFIFVVVYFLIFIYVFFFLYRRVFTCRLPITPTDTNIQAQTTRTRVVWALGMFFFVISLVLFSFFHLYHVFPFYRRVFTYRLAITPTSTSIRAQTTSRVVWALGTCFFIFFFCTCSSFLLTYRLPIAPTIIRNWAQTTRLALFGPYVLFFLDF